MRHWVPCGWRRAQASFRGPTGSGMRRPGRACRGLCRAGRRVPTWCRAERLRACRGGCALPRAGASCLHCRRWGYCRVPCPVHCLRACAALRHWGLGRRGSGRGAFPRGRGPCRAGARRGCRGARCAWLRHRVRPRNAPCGHRCARRGRSGRGPCGPQARERARRARGPHAVRRCRGCCAADCSRARGTRSCHRGSGADRGGDGGHCPRRCSTR